MKYQDIQDRDGIKFGKEIRIDLSGETVCLVGEATLYPEHVSKKLAKLGARYMSRLILEEGHNVCESNLANGRHFWDAQGHEVAHMTPGAGLTPVSRVWDEAFLKNQYFTDGLW